MVKPQEDTFLPEYMRESIDFTAEEKEASAYYPLFEVPFWTSNIQDKKAIPAVLEHFKMSHNGSNFENAGRSREDQISFPAGRPWNIIQSRTRLSIPQSNGVNLLDDGYVQPFLETVKQECVRILQHSPKDHFIHRDQLAISGAYVGFLPPGCCLEQNIAPNNELVGLLILETPPMTGELSFQDPAWITKSMTLHNADGSTFPSPEVTQDFSFDEGQIFLYPSWLPMSIANNRKVDDPTNTGIWFVSLRISTRNRFLNPAVVIHDQQKEADDIYKQVVIERDKYRDKLQALGEPI